MMTSTGKPGLHIRFSLMHQAPPARIFPAFARHFAAFFAFEVQRFDIVEIWRATAAAE